MIWLNWCINYISGQTTGFDHRSAGYFHSDSALYPDSSFQSDSGLSQGGTDSGLHPHSCLHPDSGFLAFLIIVHNTVHTLIHVIFN